jgi:UDP-3-O-[3-hydroxymyristoyl] glucosamine N-acyltransferase
VSCWFADLAGLPSCRVLVAMNLAVGSWARIENKAVIGEDVFIKVRSSNTRRNTESNARQWLLG